MYRNVPTRRLGQDDDSLSAFSDFATSPAVDVSLSPLMLGGLGLLAFALLLQVGKKTTHAVRRKGKALRKALKA